MGAMSWRYYARYRPDPEAALQELRAEVFAHGAYVDPASSPEQHFRQRLQQAGLDADAPELQQSIDELRRMQRYMDTGAEEDLRAVPHRQRTPMRKARQMMNLFGQAPRRSRRRPRTIDELLEQAGESGTHSILDIAHVAAVLGDGVAAPFPTSELLRVYGGTEPTHVQVEEHWADIAEGLDRWQAYYLAVFQDGQPAEYAFVGCSGD